MDASGLLDPFVRVIFHGYTLSTKVIKQSLNPFWNQTIVFPPIILYGTREHIKLSPPKVVVEAIDKDLCGTMEFCGRCIMTPLVKLNTESYVTPYFPPKLTWCQLTSENYLTGSSILAALELIEVGNSEIVDLPLDANTDKVYQVPDDIRPKMTRYRLEVIFWGIRDMKKINFAPVHRPKIVVECAGILINSEIIENARKNCNFNNNHVIIDLDLPEEIIHYPSITIKAYDSRGFGCFKYSGICVVPTAYMFLQKLITQEDYENQIFDAKLPSKSHFMVHQSLSVPYAFSEHYMVKDESLSLINQKKPLNSKSLLRNVMLINFIKQPWKKLFSRLQTRRTRTKEPRDINVDNQTLDWWSKYYASLEVNKNKENGLQKIDAVWETKIATFTIYSTELEMQPQFSGFEDRIKNFDLLTGKRSGDPYYDQNNYVGRFKVK